MNKSNAFEHFVADQFDRAHSSAPPNDAVLEGVISHVRHTRQRPRWLAVIKEPPMRMSSSLVVGSPTARLAAVIVATMLVTLMLAGAGLAGARLLAVEEDDGFLSPIPAVPFTGTWEGDPSGLGPFDWEWRLGPGYAFAPESLEHEQVTTFEASDPRIGGTWTQVTDFRSFAMYPEDEGVQDPFIPLWRGSIRIENEDGAWAGTFDAYKVGDDLGPEWYRLEGEGDYEGLTAVFRWIPEDDLYDGVIVPGVPPDYPPPIEPTVNAVESPSE